GMLVGQTQSFPDCPGGAPSCYDEYRIGGTSLSSPLFAGVMALADQAAGGPHGFANPALYARKGSAAFRDVTSPSKTMAEVRVDYANTVNASDGLVDSIRFLNQTESLATTPGYDDVTGLG